MYQAEKMTTLVETIAVTRVRGVPPRNAPIREWNSPTKPVMPGRPTEANIKAQKRAE